MSYKISFNNRSEHIIVHLRISSLQKSFISNSYKLQKLCKAKILILGQELPQFFCFWSIHRS